MEERGNVAEDLEGIVRRREVVGVDCRAAELRLYIRTMEGAAYRKRCGLLILGAWGDAEQVLWICS